MPDRFRRFEQLDTMLAARVDRQLQLCAETVPRTTGRRYARPFADHPRGSRKGAQLSPRDTQNGSCLLRLRLRGSAHAVSGGREPASATRPPGVRAQSHAPGFRTGSASSAAPRRCRSAEPRHRGQPARGLRGAAAFPPLDSLQTHALRTLLAPTRSFPPSESAQDRETFINTNRRPCPAQTRGVIRNNQLPDVRVVRPDTCS